MFLGRPSLGAPPIYRYRAARDSVVHDTSFCFFFFFYDTFHSPLAYFHSVSFGRFQSEASSTKFHRVREGKEERERAKEIHRVHYKFRMVSRGRIVYSMFVFLFFQLDSVSFRYFFFFFRFLFVHAFPRSLKIDLSIVGERADERQTGCVEKEVAVSQRGGWWCTAVTPAVQRWRWRWWGVAEDATPSQVQRVHGRWRSSMNGGGTEMRK